jgi:hypothetical protein
MLSTSKHMPQDSTVLSQLGEYKNMVDGLRNEVRMWKSRCDDYSTQMKKFDESHEDTFATTQHVHGLLIVTVVLLFKIWKTKYLGYKTNWWQVSIQKQKQHRPC